MIHKNLVLKIFEGFSIERWNDLIRPFDIIEMDKAAEKMVLAYVIGKYEEQKGEKIDWEWMIYASFFDLLRKIALCDIKSPVQRMIRSQYPEEYVELNKWVISQYKDILCDGSKTGDLLFNRFVSFVNEDSHTRLPKEIDVTRRVLRAAHKYSTLREFEMVRVVNENRRLQKIEEELNSDLQDYLDLRGVQLLITKQKPFDFILMVEKLRFQTRWNQTPRVPKTSVLGHSFFTAIITLLFTASNETPVCRKRMYNNFFSALFHDLPEAVTRDIISPVKQATHTLPDIVKKIEDSIVKQELLPLMEDFYCDELMYFTGNEFENRIIAQDGCVHLVSFEELQTIYNSDIFSPVDGKLVRSADQLSALIEADSSIRHGITSEHLRDGRSNILQSYKNRSSINGQNVAQLFAEFDCAL